jgi:hypothetical protein
MSSQTNPQIVNPGSVIKDIDFFLKIPVGLTVVGFISILISFMFNAPDAEAIGYFIIAAAIIVSFIVIATYKIFIRENKQISSPMAMITLFLNIFLTNLPALLMASQFFLIGWILTDIRSWMKKNNPPPIFSKIKNFVNLGLLVQFIVYQMYYVKSIKDTKVPAFNTAAFAILSIITGSLICYMYVIVKFFTVDG